LNRLIIKSDSAYVANAMTSSIFKWQNNGWLTSSRTPANTMDLWEKMLLARSALRELDVTVDSWHVPREENTEVDSLAREGV
ncbi:ribonuclease H-like domain-containing protein, partial [Dactylonectria estremocensis]